MTEGNKLFHMDRSNTLTLVIEKKRNDNGEWTPIRDEWDAKKLREEIGYLFKQTPLFPVGKEEFDYACKVIDKYIMDNCNKAELEEYEKEDKIPERLLYKVPELLKPFWDILIRVNQNKRCSFRVLGAPIPGFEEIDVRLWSGYKVLGPFNSEMNFYYNTVRVSGAPNEVEKFLRKYRK